MMGNMASFVSLKMKDLMVEEVTLTLIWNMVSMVSLRKMDLLVEEVSLTLMGNMASMVSIVSLLMKVSLVQHKYHVVALAIKVMKLVAMVSTPLGVLLEEVLLFISQAQDWLGKPSAGPTSLCLKWWATIWLQKLAHYLLA